MALTQDRPSRPGAIATPGAATLEPVTIPHLFIEEEQRERWIEILHRPERSLVTTLELLSPSNKEESGLHRYRDKRFALLLQNVHLVEVDLLLGGRRLPLRDPLPPADYYVLISRGDQRPNCHVYHWTLRPTAANHSPCRSRRQTRTCPSTLARSSPSRMTRAVLPVRSTIALLPRFTWRPRRASKCMQQAGQTATGLVQGYGGGEDN